MKIGLVGLGWIEQIEYMIRKLFLVSTLSVVCLGIGQAKTIQNDVPVDITGTITHDYSGKKAIKMEHFYITSVNGDIVTMNERQWPVKRIEVLFVASYAERSEPYKATMAALSTGKTVTLHGKFEWNQGWNQLFFQVH